MRVDIAKAVLPSLAAEDYRVFVEQYNESETNYRSEAYTAAGKQGLYFRHTTGRYYNPMPAGQTDANAWTDDPANETNPDIIRQLMMEGKLPSPSTVTLDTTRAVMTSLAFAADLMQRAGLLPSNAGNEQQGDQD